MRNVLLLVVSIVMVLSAAWTQSRTSKDESWSQSLPPGNARELVLSSCSSCHDLKSVVNARKSRAGWAKCMNDMIQRGAPVFPEEIGPITDYLFLAFGPTVPELVNVNTATREDLEKLPRLTPEIVARILEARSKVGHFKNSEQLRRALGMEKDDFEKTFYLLKYGN